MNVPGRVFVTHPLILAVGTTTLIRLSDTGTMATPTFWVVASACSMSCFLAGMSDVRSLSKSQKRAGVARQALVVMACLVGGLAYGVMRDRVESDVITWVVVLGVVSLVIGQLLQLAVRVGNIARWR